LHILYCSDLCFLNLNVNLIFMNFFYYKKFSVTVANQFTVQKIKINHVYILWHTLPQTEIP